VNNRKRSIHQEKRLASELGGRTQPGSGAMWHMKGDVITDRLFVEAKLTDKKQYTLKLETLEKVAAQAPISGKIPTMIVTFELARRDFAIIPKEDLMLLLEESSQRERVG
jgi:hypothetical protein